MNQFETKIHNFVNKPIIKPLLILIIVFYGRYIFDYLLIKNKFLYTILLFVILYINKFSIFESIVISLILISIVGLPDTSLNS